MQAIHSPNTAYGAIQAFQSFVELSDDRWQSAVRNAPSGTADSLVVSWQHPVKLQQMRGVRVVATAGNIWVTQSGRSEDHVLEVGNSVLVTEDEAVITAFGEGRALLIPSVNTPSNAPSAKHQALPWARALAARYLRWAHRLTRAMRAAPGGAQL